jgi:hypothetical protein
MMVVMMIRLRMMIQNCALRRHSRHESLQRNYREIRRFRLNVKRIPPYLDEVN